MYVAEDCLRFVMYNWSWMMFVVIELVEEPDVSGVPTLVVLGAGIVRSSGWAIVVATVGTLPSGLDDHVEQLRSLSLRKGAHRSGSRRSIASGRLSLRGGSLRTLTGVYRDTVRGRVLVLHVWTNCRTEDDFASGSVSSMAWL